MFPWWIARAKNKFLHPCAYERTAIIYICKSCFMNIPLFSINSFMRPFSWSAFCSGKSYTQLFQLPILLLRPMVLEPHIFSFCLIFPNWNLAIFSLYWNLSSWRRTAPNASFIFKAVCKISSSRNKGYSPQSWFMDLHDLLNILQSFLLGCLLHRRLWKWKKRDL